jgi:hypothetical protein
MGCLISLFKSNEENIEETKHLIYEIEYESDSEYYDELDRPSFFTDTIIKRYYYQFYD